ncbi:HAD-IA family hydrolase [Paracoccus denitrificans]|uniref:HAD-IA family hydrolase n=1 Tax=Paracoccus denitrificans TaxID=266 RepID=UPI001F3E8A5B|nr:HAD-IA family hydrolase [Paracoccus denitrificans]
MTELKHAPASYAAFLFDMDGTLLTSIPVVERVWTEWARRVGVPVADVLAYLHGRRAVDTVRRFAPPHALIDEEVAWVEAREIEDVDGVVAIAGAVELLASLAPERWAVVTSASRKLALRRMEVAELPLPRFMVTSDDVSQGKPDPEGYHRGAGLLGVDIARCLVFEDTEAGLLAGRAAGAQVIRIAGPHTAPQGVGVPTISDYDGLRVLSRPDGMTLSCASMGPAVP